ncbi:helix-turn-helix domain-containing protein [Lederbergia citri]|uniref:Helix-turn-helix transcriptional regulator n=1 Tax=Lederbergia citri TaxID=2833580 RepID=A0A942YFC1_9BACI|nr:helix-turn-helix transcriptional regulator [Lederbergia citri]MBS4193474.1 helix-turn-helix transcriptional regulator [Lederbergia citri]
MIINGIRINLEKVMKEKGYNIGTLAEKAEMHRNGISKIINGKNNGIEFDTLDKLCTALDCNVGDIIEHVKNDNPK